MARVDLIIPTFNGVALLKACLHTLESSTFTDFRLIVVDDGSTVPLDRSLVAPFRNAVILRNEQNQGLTRVFNRAIDASDSEFVVLLNDDTEVEPDWLEELVDCADRYPDAGSIASKMRLASDRDLLHSAGDTWSAWGMPGNRGVWLPDTGQYDVEDEIFSACGGAVLYRRSALESVRLPNGEWFDSRLFMYCEDVELGWRLQIAGYPCRFAPKAVVYHHLSATGGGALASYYVARNLWLLYARTIPQQLWERNRWRIIAHQIGRFCRNLPHLREPAARRSIAGTLRGVTLFLTNRQTRPVPSPATLDRIHGLIIDR